MNTRRVLFSFFLFLLLTVHGVSGNGKREGTIITPESFLRGFDPITVYFDTDLGPSGGGALDEPGDFLRLSPPHPGEYRWIDGRTLSFFPSAAWPILREYRVTVQTRSVTLTTMMAPPTRISPPSGSTQLEPLDTLNLTFSTPMGLDELGEMISFETRPLPGLGDSESLWLTNRDFVLKELDRTSIRDAAQYQLTFNRPIGYGRHITMHLRLSLDENIKGSLAKYSFSTKPEFRLASMGCGSIKYPVATNGSVYSQEQAIACGTGSTPLFLEFTEDLAPLGIDDLKSLVRFEPAVKNLSHRISRNLLYLSFEAERDKAYRISVHHQRITSSTGRPLADLGETSLYFYYRQSSPFLRWERGQSIVERYGPQFFPMSGRATENVDLRIHRVDPLDRNFWPFPKDPVVVDEESQPRMPGEEPAYATQLADQIRLLGSPEISRVIKLPMTGHSGQVRFGLDLEPHLIQISGHWKPGTYLIGYRLLGSSTKRNFVRLSVTDLSLSTVEEEHGINFVVTSLRMGSPIAGAKITVEGDFNGTWRNVIEGTTDEKGQFHYTHERAIRQPVRRIMVSHGDDILVLDPRMPPPHFQNNHWFGTSSSWLAWLSSEPRREKEASRQRAYILTERPVYRPEEPVYILGYVRQRQEGKILAPDFKRQRSLIIDGPGKKYWTFPISLEEGGQFSFKFHEEDLPTGDYTAILRDDQTGGDLSVVTFKKESYRIPRFEARISGPDRVALDQPFELVLTADYYAGGRVVGQQVSWEITQYPYQVSPPHYPGYLFSTDDRFTGGRPFRSTGSSRKSDVTDENGSSRISLNPALEEDGRPRRYIVEATVRGADAQTVTTVKQVLALPSFILGIKVERLLNDSQIIRPEILVIDHNEKPLAGKPFKLRLYQRQWHSYLKETDFTTGEAQYVTDVVDKILFEDSYTSSATAIKPELPVEDSGVYVVEVLAKDKLGRLQQVQADLYVPGETPVAWKKTYANVFETTTDKKRYVPGDTARILLMSPFQQAAALLIVEKPGNNSYHWVEIKNGQGLFSLPIEENMTPSLPVHALLLRGRIGGTGRDTQVKEDRGRPIAMANTTWIAVDPAANQAKLSLKHEEVQLPGSRMKMDIRLTDNEGRPLDGQVALWLVDRAVLALGEEKPIDPLSAFIDPVSSYLRLRETRNEVVGNLPVEEMPGGGEYMESARELSLLEKTTVRRTFKTVPYFNPRIPVKAGRAEVAIELPENLTEFAVRAVGLSGFDRFGTARSVVSIRLPIIVQSALPRFVRPGDNFNAGGIARVVEGKGGAGTVALQVEGLKIDGQRDSLEQPMRLDERLPEKLFYNLQMPGEGPSAGLEEVTVRMAVERSADQARDGFEIKLPVKRDIKTRRIDSLQQLETQKEYTLPYPAEPFRQGSLKQTVILTDEPAVLRMMTGMRLLIAYEHLCTEQRVSQLLPAVALQKTFTNLGLGDRYTASASAMRDTFTYLEKTLKPEGLYAFWPGSRGYVGLTAYVVEFLVLAKASGYEFKEELLERPINALKEALRSDYPGLLPGNAFEERVEALTALSLAGFYDEGYAQDLLVGALNADLYSQGKILSLFLALGNRESKAVQRLRESLWKSTIFKLQNSREVFAGLEYRNRTWGGLILASEIKTLSSVSRALYRAEPGNPRVRLMIDDIVNRGGYDGWGSTNANAAALLTLGEVLEFPAETATEGHRVELRSGGQTRSLDTQGKAVTVYTTDSQSSGTLSWKGGNDKRLPYAWLSADYVPTALGDQSRQQNKGFVVERELMTIGTDGAVRERRKTEAGGRLSFDMDTVVEEHISVVNPEERNFVAVRVPFAAGFELLNPELATAPKEARPSGRLTRSPDYALFEDDQVTFYYDTLPEGSYDFYFRLRASFEGSYTQPPANAELMYDARTYGSSDGTRILIRGKAR